MHALLGGFQELPCHATSQPESHRQLCRIRVLAQDSFDRVWKNVHMKVDRRHRPFSVPEKAIVGIGKVCENREHAY
jgi:hypothetical protein